MPRRGRSSPWRSGGLLDGDGCGCRVGYWTVMAAAAGWATADGDRRSDVRLAELALKRDQSEEFEFSSAAASRTFLDEGPCGPVRALLEERYEEFLSAS